MFSGRAKHGLSLIFSEALRRSLALSPSDTVEVQNGVKAPSGSSEGVLALTIGSYLFRVFVVFQFAPDVATRAYFTRGNLGAEFSEAVGEIGNMCCGAINRRLGEYFQHMGMSTPSLLNGLSLDYLEALKPNFIDHCRIVVAGEASLHATFCCRAYAPVDFVIAAAAVEEVTGDLELF